MAFPELTYQNHFQYFYDSEPFSQRKSADQNWKVQYGKPRSIGMTFKEACLYQAKLIQSRASRGKIGILCSGGIDSEVTLISFVEAGIPVKAYIGRMSNDYNFHDICYAIMVCEKNSISYTLIDYDFEKMMQEKGSNYAEISQCFSPQLINVMYLMDQIYEFVVVGCGVCVLKRTSLEKNDWQLNERERVVSWYKFLLHRNRESCPGFFQFTPEAIFSYANDPFVREQFLSAKYINSSDFKLAMYSRHFNLVARPKLTGFEKIQDIDYRYRSQLLKSYGMCDSVFKTDLSFFENENLIKNNMVF